MSEKTKKLLRSRPHHKSYAQIDERQEQPECGQMERSDKNQPQRSIFDNKNWNFRQKLKLMLFIQFYGSHPDWNSDRRSIHLYKHLSNFLKKKRTPEQCKNIHSLLKRKFDTFREMWEAIAEELKDKQDYQRLFDKYKNELTSFQAQYSILDADQGVSQSLKKSSVRQLPKEVTPRLQVKDSKKQKQAEKDQAVAMKLQQPQKNRNFIVQRDYLVKQCDYHLTEWLKWVNILKLKQDIN